MGRLKWYKRDPVAWLHGTRKLSLAERGAYADVLELIYSHDGRLEDDDEDIAAWLRCHLRTWRSIKSRLIDVHKKLSVIDGFIVNNRCSEEVETTLKILSSRVEAGRKGGFKSGVVRRKNKALDEANLHKNDEAKTKPTTTRKDISDSLRNPHPIDGSNGGDAFEVFWGLYPRRVGKAAARRAYSAANRKASSAAILAGVDRYRRWIERNGEAPQFVKHPATWLNQECWDDELVDRRCNGNEESKNLEAGDSNWKAGVPMDNNGLPIPVLRS